MSEKKYCSACGQPINGYSPDYIERQGQPKPEGNLMKLLRATYKAVEWATRPPKHNSAKNK